MTTTDRQNLIACYLSGQIAEQAWQEHLRMDQGLGWAFEMARIPNTKAKECDSEPKGLYGYEITRLQAKEPSMTFVDLEQKLTTDRVKAWEAKQSQSFWSFIRRLFS
jgi:hypothetical protein